MVRAAHSGQFGFGLSNAAAYAVDSRVGDAEVLTMCCILLDCVFPLSKEVRVTESTAAVFHSWQPNIHLIL